MFEKLEKIVFLALVFSIPFQKRHFLFGPISEGENFFEWGSGFFYFTDFLVLALFLFVMREWIFSSRRRREEKIHLRVGVPLLLFSFLGFAFISLTQADLINVGVYRFTKLAEFVLLFFYVATRIRLPSPAEGWRGQSNRSKIPLGAVLWAFITSGIFQSMIAILQFAKQSSLGLEIFHESTLAIHMKGVAHIASDGLFLIRAYGTFQSPNVLAGFLGLCLLFAFYLFVIYGAKKNGNEHGGNYIIVRPYDNVIFLFFMPVVIFLVNFGFLLTFSRGTIVFFALSSTLFFTGMFLLKQFQKCRKPAKVLAALVIASWLMVIALAWPEVSSRFLGSSFDEPAIQERFFFNKIGVESVRGDPMHALFGIGIGNFVHNFKQLESGLPDYLYQPVHNIFILIASETGTLGFFAFALFVAVFVERVIKVFLIPPPAEGGGRDQFLLAFTLLPIVCFVLLIGMYDHYFWTLQQGALIFWITLGLIEGAIRKYN